MWCGGEREDTTDLLMIGALCGRPAAPSAAQPPWASQNHLPLIIAKKKKSLVTALDIVCPRNIDFSFFIDFFINLI